MQKLPPMPCGDGFTRADNGAFASWTKFLAKTANYTILPLDTGSVFTNRAAAGAVTFTLPSPKAGMWFIFQKVVNNQNIVINTAAAGDKIHNLTQGVTLTNSTTEYGMVLVWTDGTAWFVGDLRGTWAVS